MRLLEENMDILHATSKLLVLKEKVTGEEFRELFNEDMRDEILSIAEVEAGQRAVEKEKIIAKEAEVKAQEKAAKVQAEMELNLADLDENKEVTGGVLLEKEDENTQQDAVSLKKEKEGEE